MAVKLRLSVSGKKGMTIHKFVAVDGRKKRESNILENLGTYDVVKHQFIKFDEENFQKWLSQGAVPTHSVKKLYRRYKKQNKSAS